ncbi:MAG: hypothetical protein DGJ47_000227 [Rickettsiaceae bacterium]
MKNYLLRAFSGIIIVSLIISLVFFYRAGFNVLLYIISYAMLWEWYDMTKSNIWANFCGFIIIPIAILSLLIISYLDHNGWILLTYFALIWSVDVMAMIGGKLIGGPKMAPHISPNKTLSGLLVGVISAVLVVRFISTLKINDFAQLISLEYILIDSAILAITAQISDLFISIFKRKFEIKDTGTIIPGHGGVLDRFDSIILTAPIVAFWLNNFYN